LLNTSRFRISLWPLLPLSLVLMGFCILAGCASTGTSTPSEGEFAPLTQEQQELNVESFDVVWQTIADKHYDETLGGLDWAAVGDSLRPTVAAATTMEDARAPMREMIRFLDKSHFVIYPADIYDDAAGSVDADGEKRSSHSGQPGHSGLDVRVLGGKALVTGVSKGSSAADLGIVPGWEMLRIGSVDLDERLEKLAEVLADKTTAGLVMSRSVEARLGGDDGDTVAVTFLDAAGQEVNVDLVLGPAPGSPFRMGNLPEVRVWTRQEVLEGGIGYFHFNFFLDVMKVMGEYNKAMESFRDLPGVIIDLRGNPGGLGAMAMGMAGWFVEEKGQRLGTMIMRTGEFNFIINTRAKGYDGRVALLIDNLSGSTSEIFAGGLQDLALARIFGMRTAGAALPSNIIKLPNGDGFQFAVANYISEGGEVLEGVGVAPDVEVVPTRESLLAEGDPILEAARQWLIQKPSMEE
jgi:carboxyl-terminal processing protease